MIRVLSARYIRILLQMLLDGIVLGCVRKGNTEGGNTVAVFVRMDNLGDFFLWLPFAEGLVKADYSGRRVILVCDRTISVLAEKTGLFYKVIGVSKRQFTRSLAYRARIMRRLRRIEAEVAIQMTYSRSVLIGDSILRAVGANKKINSSGDWRAPEVRLFKFANRMFDNIVPETPEMIHEADRSLHFCRSLGNRGLINSGLLKGKSCLKLDKEIKNYLLVCPKTSDARKDWPLEFYERVIKEVLEFSNYQVIVCSNNRVDLRVESRHTKNRLRNLSGKSSLLEYVELVRTAKHVLTGDTSAVHIANYFDRPVSCIAGGGQPGRFLPFDTWGKDRRSVTIFKPMSCMGCNWECFDRSGDVFPCIKSITVEDVVNELKSRLS